MGIIKKFRIKSFKSTFSEIEFEDISLSYGNRLILDKINFKISKGEIFGMLVGDGFCGRDRQLTFHGSCR